MGGNIYIYINDFVNSSNVLQKVLLADDNLFLAHKSPFELEQILNTEISKTDKWFKCHKYSINVSKTNYMIFRTQQKQDYAEHVHLGINGQTISTIKFLGIILDECLNFKGHIDALVKKLSKYVDLLTKLRYFLPS